MVLTCLNRFETVTNVDKTGTVQVGSPRIYAISHTDNATHYRVSENDENMPYAHVLHENSHITRANIFFAVFLNWSWEALSPLYLNSPNLELDIYSKEKYCSATEDGCLKNWLSQYILP